MGVPVVSSVETGVGVPVVSSVDTGASAAFVGTAVGFSVGALPDTSAICVAAAVGRLSSTGCANADRGVAVASMQSASRALAKRFIRSNVHSS